MDGLTHTAWFDNLTIVEPLTTISTATAAPCDHVTSEQMSSCAVVGVCIVLVVHLQSY